MQIKLNNIENILFDLGGVLWNIDYSILIESFRKIGLEHFEQHFAQAKQEQLFDLYEKGLISSAEFRERLQQLCIPGTTMEQIDMAWNSMILDFPDERLQLLLRAKKQYRTFLLSNTNAIHMEHIYADLNKNHQLPDFSACFEKVYLSFEMHKRKPEPEIFLQVLKENNLQPEKTLFIDDSIQHVESAQKLGIQAVWLDIRKTNVIALLGI